MMTSGVRSSRPALGLTGCVGQTQVLPVGGANKSNKFHSWASASVLACGDLACEVHGLQVKYVAEWIGLVNPFSCSVGRAGSGFVLWVGGGVLVCRREYEDARIGE